MDWFVVCSGSLDCSEVVEGGEGTGDLYGIVGDTRASGESVD